MEEIKHTQQEIVDKIYNYAANLLINENKSQHEVIRLLVKQGIDEEISKVIVTNIQNQIRKAKQERASKDMLYGALWCIGGIVATVADLGFIFWGAIVFGAIQFFKGLVDI